LCGIEVRHLSAHLIKSKLHSASPRDYRRALGISQHIPLCTKDMSQAISSELKRQHSKGAFDSNICGKRLRSDNTTGFKGVMRFRDGSRFIAILHHGNKQHHLGLFDKAEEAARAYDEKVRELHGERAITNEDLGLYNEEH